MARKGAFGKGDQLLAPFPYFGGKSRVVNAVWSRLGDPMNYIEPFCGSAAMLLGRPDPPTGVGRKRTETVNDYDSLLINFWRAVRDDPEQVAHYADWPVSEVDLVARNKALIQARSRLAQLWDDPEDYDAKLAGWWVWGSNLWIGSGFAEDRSIGRVQVPLLESNGQGINSERITGQGKLHLGNPQGVNNATISKGIPQIKLPDMMGRGTQSARMTKLQVESTGHMPHISDDGTGVLRSSLATEESIKQYLIRLQARLRRVRICCGDWQRVLSNAVTTRHGVTAVFLDPPYQMDTKTKRSKTYQHDSGTLFDEVWTWAISVGDDAQWRIALCGYDDGRATPEGWEKFRWKAQGGYGNQKEGGQGKQNAARETIWFSPHCDGMLGQLFSGNESDLLDIETEEHDATNT